MRIDPSRNQNVQVRHIRRPRPPAPRLGRGQGRFPGGHPVQDEEDVPGPTGPAAGEGFQANAARAVSRIRYVFILPFTSTFTTMVRALGQGNAQYYY